MGAASSQSQQLKVHNPSINKHHGSNKQFDISKRYSGDIEEQKTQSRILVSINTDNTVRISEGKSIATQTPRDGYTLIEDKGNTETNKTNAAENTVVKKVKRDISVQTDVIIGDRECKSPVKEDNDITVPPLHLDKIESTKLAESTDLDQEKEDIYRSVNIAESENDAGETDYSTDIGIQTDDDFENEQFGPKLAWGSKSVDSAITLHQNIKEANNDEEKERDTHSDLDTPTPARPFDQLSLDRYGKYKVRLESDKEKCIMSSATFLETGDAVVIDRSNQKIKFVDKKFKFISSHELDAKPWAVCAKGIDVYVTMGNTKIQHLTVEDMIMEPGELFEIKGRCLGICIFGDHIAVGLQVGEICLLDFKGKKQGTIELPTVNNRSCNPWHLAVTSEDNILVTDSDAGVVYCVNRKSELIFAFNGLGLPRGTCIDTEGNILAVGRDKETGTVVTILHKDAELQHMLHIEQQSEMRNRALMTWVQLEFVPYCICYRQDRTVILGGLQESLKIMKIG